MLSVGGGQAFLWSSTVVLRGNGTPLFRTPELVTASHPDHAQVGLLVPFLRALPTPSALPGKMTGLRTLLRFGSKSGLP